MYSAKIKFSKKIFVEWHSTKILKKIKNLCRVPHHGHSAKPLKIPNRSRHLGLPAHKRRRSARPRPRPLPQRPHPASASPPQRPPMAPAPGVRALRPCARPRPGCRCARPLLAVAPAVRCGRPRPASARPPSAPAPAAPALGSLRPPHTNTADLVSWSATGPDASASPVCCCLSISYHTCAGLL